MRFVIFSILYLFLFIHAIAAEQQFSTYNHEFEDEQELIKIIEEINLKVNKQVNSSI